MAVIGLVPHPHRPVAVALASEAAGWLRQRGHEARPIPGSEGGDPWRCHDSESVRGLDLAVSLGGDGTMLRTVGMVCAAGVPVLGVNVGHLGYLSPVGPDGLLDGLERFLAGDYEIEQRMTLEVTVEAGEGEPAVLTALNDVVLQRTVSGHTARLAASLDGEPFLTYVADSVIVATPTGSTAYNLSARGPVVSPRARVLVLTPVAAHNLFDRSLVLAADEGISLEVLDDRPAELVVDGHTHGTLTGGSRLACRAGPDDARLVSFGGRAFHSILRQKFGLEHT